MSPSVSENVFIILSGIFNLFENLRRPDLCSRNSGASA